MNIIAARNICEDEVNTDKNIRVYREPVYCILLTSVLNTIYTGWGGFQNSHQLFPVCNALSVKRH